MYICQSQSPNSSHHHHHLRHFPPLVSIRLFSTSVSLFLPCKPVRLYHFSRLHIYVLIYAICFSLSDLLHSVWQSLDPSAGRFLTTAPPGKSNCCDFYLYYFLFSVLSSSVLKGNITHKNRYQREGVSGRGEGLMGEHSEKFGWWRNCVSCHQ